MRVVLRRKPLHFLVENFAAGSAWRYRGSAGAVFGPHLIENAGNEAAQQIARLVEAWGEPTVRVKGKIFAMHATSGTHHSPERPAVWILSVSVEQDFVIRARPDRYFKPPYVGPSGWIGAWLDQNPPWNEIEELLRDGWRRRAPKKIAALLGD